MRHLGYVVLVWLLVSPLAMAQPKKDTPVPQIGHMVFFKLKEPTAANQKTLINACKKYLSKHSGTVYFSAGARAKAFDREVNDQDWDVALHLVFQNKAAHDRYQTHPDHLKFIEENKALWANVRVFDSEILPLAGPKDQK